MLYLLNPRVWIAAALIVAAIVSHTIVYRAGKANVKAKWDAERVVQIEVSRKVEAQYRAKEQQLVAAKNESEAKYAALKKRYEASAAGARTELDRLRDQLAAPGGAATPNPSACPGAFGRAGLERELLGHCATALVGLAAEADRLEALVVGLQGYVKNVCLKAAP